MFFLITLITISLLYVFLRFFTKKTMRFLSILAYPFVKICIAKRVSNGLEDKQRVYERYGIPSKERPSGDLIWIHSVSVGETISVIPVIQEIKNQNPNISILLTTTTLTAAKQVKNRLKNLVIHQFMPFDIFKWVKNFIDYWKPDVAIFVESELWANILFYLKEKSIPTYLVNARFSERSKKHMIFIKNFFKILPLSIFKSVFVTTNNMEKIVKMLGANNTKILPNLKIIADKLPVNYENKIRLQNKISERPAWIAVSTHPSEEQIIMDVHNKLRSQIPDILTVIAIRHPERCNEVKSIACDFNLSYSIYSKNMKIESKLTSDLLIVDAIGCLGDFFEVIDTVLMCGSFIPGIGGHNFLEPLKFGCNVATGVYIHNFEDVYENVSQLCKKVSNADEIAEFVINSKKDFCRSTDILNITDLKKQWSLAINDILRDIQYVS